MTRGLSSAQNTYLAGDALIVATLVEIGLYNASNYYYTDAPFDITIGSTTYEAQGVFMGISENQEAADLQVTSINLTLSALDVTVRNAVAKSANINQVVTIQKVLLDPTTMAPIGGNETIVIFKGKIVGYRIDNNNDTATMVLEINSQFTNFLKVSGRKTNLGSFQKEHPTDFSMEYSHEPTRDIKWGKV
jgi:hypothetical protein